MTSEERSTRVTCPRCDSAYLLPLRLFGPGGARVRCPSCSETFDVPAPGDSPPAPSIEAGAAAASEANAPAGPSPAAARSSARPDARAHGETATGAARAATDIALDVIGRLAEREGAALDQSLAEGRLFAKFGPALFSAYDEYRARAPQAGPGPFRAALRERWGVDLPEVTPRA
jgi:predicted Zn finger-like uncharacterized protein